MFQRILVPLDGSKGAEHAIPLATRIARASSGSLVLLRVVLSPSEVGTYGAGIRGTTAVKPEAEAKARDLAEANSYLATLMTTYAADLEDLAIATEAVTGATAPTIFASARYEHADLIVMCSHGETGLKRWVVGSVAHEAVRHSPVPVLVLNEHGVVPPISAAGHPLRIVVPVDGSELAEIALQPAAQLVAALASPAQGELHLLRVVDLPSAYGKMKSQAHISDATHEEVKKEAETYVQALAERLRATDFGGGLSIGSSLVDNSDVAATIIKQAEATAEGSAGSDLIAIATHGRGGLRRVLMGSMAEHLLGHTKLPLLVVRPAQGEAAEAEKSGEATEVTEVEVQTWSGLL